MSYAELDAASDRWASILLHGYGISPGDLVGLYVNRSTEMVAAMIGIMKAGAGFVPIDPVYPDARIAYMLDQSKARVVITEGSLAANLRASNRQIVLLDSQPGQGIAVAQTPISERLRLCDERSEYVAYVIFTSGTTGQPKGVLVPHRAVSAFINGMIDRPGLGCSDRFLTNASISFDMTIYEIFLPLAVGAEVVMTSREIAGDGEHLLKSLIDFKITSMIATPATWRLILTAGWQGTADFKAVCGGEAFGRDLANEMVARCGSVWNIYGPTETTVICLVEEVKHGQTPVLLGFPTRGTELYVVDIQGALVTPGAIGELLIGGPQVSLGYLNAPELTDAKFIRNSFNDSKSASILYRSGDLVRRTSDGNLEYHGRTDHQVKIRGYRIEIGEIAAGLAKWPEIKFSHIAVREDRPGDKRIVAYVILQAQFARLAVSDLKASLRQFLPEYMLPTHFMVMSTFPMTANGKVDLAALPQGWTYRDDLGEVYKAPSSDLESKIADVFAGVMQFDRIGVNDDLFAYGLNSLLATTAIALLRQQGVGLTAAQVYDALTVANLAAFAADGVPPSLGAGAVRNAPDPVVSSRDRGIAIVGMAGRFPGADNVREFWHMLTQGEEGITRFDASDLSKRLPQATKVDPNYVPSRGIIKGIEYFDAKFFGVAPIDAAMIDPQQRIFLEECWHALEDAGHVPQRSGATIGVYAGMHRSTYYSEMIRTNPDAIDRYGDFNTMIATEKDYIATRVAHRLDLMGPAVSVHTACSTSAVAIGQAVTALRAGQCDMALAGGASVTVPQRTGHIYQEGGIQSHDGKCRPFAADASGTVFSDGVGVVVLKRLADAERDGDQIYAVVIGVGINNDGRAKASFMAPSITGQRACIEAAIADAGIHPHVISHVEAHGTGTVIGDPIETAALRQALTVGGVWPEVAIGSIKGNVGHMVAAAGVASVIKTALAISRRVMPPSLHAGSVNKDCGFDSRFHVNTRLQTWHAPQGLFAGVSSFGVGGTNAHLILSAYNPINEGKEKNREVVKAALPLDATDFAIYPVSAKTAASLAASVENLVGATVGLATAQDREHAAWTMQVGRQEWVERAFVIASAAPGGEAGGIIFKSPPSSAKAGTTPEPVCWMFPGQGTQFVGMAASLYAQQPAFRQHLDASLDYLRSRHQLDMRPALLTLGQDVDDLKSTRYAQPAVLIVSLAVAHLWQTLGLRPSAVIGHSIGEFAAAVTAEVMTLEAAIDLIVLRGACSAQQPTGAMVAFRMAASELELPTGLALAAINGPKQAVVSGPSDLVESFVARLTGDKSILATRLDTSHAFHSAMMQPVAAALHVALSQIPLRAPKIPFYSTVSGELLDHDLARSANYWSEHVVATVQFAGAIAVARQGFNQFLEVGPKATLCGLLRQNGHDAFSAPSSSPSGNPALDHQHFLRAVGQLWQRGHKISWENLGSGHDRKKISMPGYAFERSRHWILPDD